ncbi:MAG TPA: alpha/beta fold hydrolase [Rhizomicrobium sp.]|jgi:pimeloyl-ACP methyl ester carboxylesterase
MLPLLLLPGMLCDAASWSAQVSGLADVSEPHVMAYGLADSFEAMADVVLAAAPERFALAGHSMGGRVAQEVYRKAPSRVAGLALLATDYRGIADEAMRATETARRDGMLAKARADGMDGFARMWVKQVVAPANLEDETLVDAAVSMMARQSFESFAAQSLAGIRRADYTEMLDRIACPTLICPGALDNLRPVAIHQEMAARIPGSQLVVIDGAAHMIAMERPDAVTAALREWLSHL